jgi:ABC-type nitrate/sulfonate/bicarbonate transport system substrate-binding protein
VGYGDSHLVGALHLAAVRKDWPENFSAEKFASTSDIIYALLSGNLEAGFVEPDKLRALDKLGGFKMLHAVGRVTYPYGATLVLRKGLDRRITELAGLRIAVSSPDCTLLKAFVQDSARLKADISAVEYTVVPFDAMLPVLESGLADAAIIKGTYAVFARQRGHSILYQNWDVTPGDKCCPAIVDQAVLMLLARKEKLPESETLVARQLAAQEEGPSAQRRAVAAATPIPLAVLEEQPVAEFASADEKLLELLLGHDHAENEDHGEGRKQGGDTRL